MKIDLYNGECLEVMDRLIEQGVMVDAIITDPPYGTTACKWDNVIPFDEMWERLNKLIKPNGAIVLFGSEPFSSLLRVSNLKMYKYDWIWDKKLPTGHLNANIMPLKKHEIVSVFSNSNFKATMYNKQMSKREKIREDKESGIISKGDGYSAFGKHKKVAGTYTHRNPTSILEYSNANKTNVLHPTQKPVALMEYLIKTYTNENETVLDFTMGSGTTGVACKNLNRNFIGIELDEKYFKIAEDRINKTSQGSLF